MGEGGLLDASEGVIGGQQYPKQGSLLAAALVGQLLAFLLSLVSVFSSLLVAKGVSLPASQTVPTYVLLALVFGGTLILRRKWPQNGLLSYAAVSLLDVEGNFLVVLAYRFTFITSVQLLNSFTIPCVFALSWLLLRARYRWQHCVGAGLCLASLLLLVSTDTATLKPDRARPLLGDALVLLGAMCYACCNVAQEKLLRRGTAVEVLAFLGVFGLLWAGIQAYAVEHAQLRALKWSPETLGLLAGYTGALFAFYSLVPVVLRWGGAAVLNLSLLTANLWACLARLLFLGGFPQMSAVAFAAALVLVTAGLVTYTCGGSIYPTTSSEDCYRVIRPGWHGDGMGHSCVETPRLNGAISGATPRASGCVGPDSGSGSHSSLRAWLARGRRADGEPAAGKGSAGDVEAASIGGEGQGIGRAGSFWMRPLPSLPIEGALTADPYAKTGNDAARNESAPPIRPA